MIVLTKEIAKLEELIEVLGGSIATLDTKLDSDDHLINVRLKKEMLYAAEKGNHWIVLKGHDNYNWRELIDDFNPLVDKNRKFTFENGQQTIYLD